jgi:hypothetical protein
MATESQINANRANAQHSAGPSSEAGLLKSSHNALKTGLYGRTILLPTDDVAAYQSFVALLNEKHQPANDYERHLVQTIIDCEWRLLRIPVLEAATFALGRRELAAEFVDETDEKVRAALLEGLIARTYKKDLQNLALQERRLRGTLGKHLAELADLHNQPDDPIQFHRRNLAMREFTLCKALPNPQSPAQFGFEITKEYLELRRSVYLLDEKRSMPPLAQFDRDWVTKLRKKAA